MPKFIVCPTCEGKGKVGNPAFNNGFTEREMDDLDETFFEDYAKGVYDVLCSECKGERVVDTEANSDTFCCGQRKKRTTEQEYPGAHVWVTWECRNPDCEEGE